MVNGSGQGALWRMCVWTFISLETFLRNTAKRWLNIVGADAYDNDANANANDAAGRRSLCCSCLLFKEVKTMKKKPFYKPI